MFRSLATAASGMEAQQTKLDVTANNIANVSTTGFKKGRAEFADLMYQTVRAPGAATGATAPAAPDAAGGRHGRAHRRDVQRDHRQGELQQTGNPLDVAIEGHGFLPVTHAQRRDRLHPQRRASSSTPRAAGQRRRLRARRRHHDPARRPERHHRRRRHGVGDDAGRDPAALEVGKIQLATFANPAGLAAAGAQRCSARPRPRAPPCSARPARAARAPCAGHARGVERQGGRGDDRPDLRPARLRGQLARDQGRRRDAAADGAAR